MLKLPLNLSLNLSRAMALLLLSMMLLAACSAPATPAQVSTSETPAATEAAADENATQDVSGGEPRVITHVMGEITLPATPQRVVVLEWSYLENVLATGVQPVGVADIEGYNAWVKIPIALSPDVVDVGRRQDPNLETIATLQPDLIIAASSRVVDSYDKLSEIAPTLVFDNYPTDMTHYASTMQSFSVIADVLGRQSEGEAVLAELDAKFAEARATLESVGRGGERFVLTQAYTSDNLAQARLFTSNAMAVEVIENIGLVNGWEDDPQPFGFSTVSMEILPELGDLNFFYVVQDDDNVFVSDAVAPLWENLEFVKNGHAYPLGGDAWLFGGPYSMMNLVDMVVGKLAPDAVAATTPSTEEAATSSTTYPLTVQDDNGDVVIPARPERVVTIGEELNEILVVLDILPVGFGSGRVERGGPKETGIPFTGDYLDTEVAGTPIYVGGQSPNLEAVAALQPDLILFPNTDDAAYNALSQIAPTLGIFPQGRQDWQRLVTLLGEIFGKQAQAAQVVADFDARVAQLREELAPIVAEHPNITLLYLPGAATTMVFDERYAFGGMVEDLGFTLAVPANVEIGDSGFSVISPEVLAGLESDAIITIQFGEGMQAEFPVEPILASLGIPILRTTIEAQRPASGPFTERFYLESFSALLQAEFGE